MSFLNDVDDNHMMMIWLEIVNTLLLNGADINNINSDEVAHLYSALGAGREPGFIRELLLAGADVTAVDLVGRTLLHSAIIADGELPLIKAILSAGADVNAKLACSQFTPLHLANTEEIVHELVLHDADVNARDMFGGTPLHFGTLANKDVGIIKALLSAKADVKALDLDNNTPLHSAVIAGRELPVIKTLLFAGADVNAKEACSQFTALHLAYTEEIVHELVLHDADVNARDMFGGTPLHFGTLANKDVGVIKELLSAKADVNALDLDDNTPLHLAVIAGRELPVIKALLFGGADVNAKEACSQFTALHLANTEEIVHELGLRGAVINARDLFGRTPLHFGTLANKDVGVIKALLSVSADVNALDLNNNTPLHSAVIAGRELPVIKALLFGGADVNAKEACSQFTALHLANTEEIVYELVLRGADVNARDLFGRTPLHFGTLANKDVGVIEALLFFNADVNALDLDNNTPLHSAIINGSSLPVIKALLFAGADVNAKEALSQFTALHLANTEEIVNELVLHDADVNARDMFGRTPLHFGTLDKKDVGVIKALLSAKADVNALDLDNNNPLHSAIINGSSLPVIEALLFAGADVNAKEAFSQFTALHLANTAEIVNDLVLHGADVNARDLFGRTPLHFGTLANKDVGVIKALLSSGADVNCEVNNSKNTALYYAHTVEITKELLAHGADVNPLDLDNNYTPLHSAVIAGRELPVIKALLLAGADVNAKVACSQFNGSDEETLLHLAIRTNKDVSLIKALLSAGADVNALDDLNNNTPLHSAVIAGREVPVIKALLFAGADVNTKVACSQFNSSDGETLLHLAIRTNKDVNLIKALLCGGADPNGVTTARPIRTAFDIGYGLLFHGSDTAGYNGETPLVSALYSNSKPEVIKLLLLAGAEARGHTVLHKCLCPEIASLLITYGADVNERDEKQNTALHTIMNLVPASSDALKVIHLLLKSGADVNARNSRNELAVESDEVIHHAGEQKLKLIADLLNYGLRSELRFNLHFNRKTSHSSHFIKMLILTHYDCYKEFLDYNISPCDATSSCSCNQWIEYFDKCEREVVRLKKYSLYNNFSLFNLVVRKPIKPLGYSTRLAIIAPSFPIYEHIIKEALRESAQQALLREMFNELTLCCWLEGCGDPVVLTFNCMNSIANYLNDHDILKFITAMSSSALINDFASLLL